MPNDLMKQYYVQRASAGLVITEFTSIANDAITFHREPCIADDAQTAKWKEIVDAVHAAGGRIFCQIAHRRGRRPKRPQGRPLLHRKGWRPHVHRPGGLHRLSAPHAELVPRPSSGA